MSAISKPTRCDFVDFLAGEDDLNFISGAIHGHLQKEHNKIKTMKSQMLKMCDTIKEKDQIIADQNKILESAGHVGGEQSDCIQKLKDECVKELNKVPKRFPPVVHISDIAEIFDWKIEKSESSELKADMPWKLMKEILQKSGISTDEMNEVCDADDRPASAIAWMNKKDSVKYQITESILMVPVGTNQAHARKYAREHAPEMEPEPEPEPESETDDEVLKFEEEEEEEEKEEDPLTIENIGKKWGGGFGGGGPSSGWSSRIKENAVEDFKTVLKIHSTIDPESVPDDKWKKLTDTKRYKDVISLTIKQSDANFTIVLNYVSDKKKIQFKKN